MPQNLALVGCGAIAQTFYLPALATHRRDFDRIWLVDPNDRALAEAWAITGGEKAHVLSEIYDNLEYVIIATPNNTHFTLSQEALSRGAHLLIEKPFVICPADGQKLLDLAGKHNRILAVNQTRRLFPYTQELHRRINAGEFGKLLSIAHNEGGKFDWPLQSGAVFARDAQRTGVIMDMGVHVIDFYQVLFQPKWKFVSAVHDGFSGPEGLAEIKLTADEVPVTIRLSRYHTQTNAARLSFERADVLLNVFDWSGFTILDKLSNRQFVTAGSRIKAFGLFADQLLSNFRAATEKTRNDHLRCGIIASSH